MNNKVEIIEIGPREGVQYHEKYIDANKKIALIEMLFDAGFSKVEATSFVHPKTMPQMRDAVDVLRGIRNKENKGTCQVLVPNETGCRDAVACQADEIVVWTFLTDELTYLTHKRRRSEVFKEIRTIVEIAELNKIKVSAYVAGAFGYPGMDSKLHQEVIAITGKLIQLGCYQVCLNDEFCVTNPYLVKKHLRIYMNEIDNSKLAVHFHDNRGLGLANVFSAYEEGIHSFKCSLGGSGTHIEFKGVSHDERATINLSHSVPTEDVVYMFEEMGVETGIEIDKLCKCGMFIEEILETRLHSNVLSNRLSSTMLNSMRKFSSDIFSSREE